MLGKHPHYKTSKPLHIFLVQDKEFENYKTKTSIEQKESLILTQLKNFQLKDTFNLLYSLVKTKFFAQIEPTDIQTIVNFDNVLKQIDKYIPILSMLLKTIEGDIEFKKECIKTQIEIVRTLLEGHEIGKESENLVEQYYKNHCMLLEVI